MNSNVYVKTYRLEERRCGRSRLLRGLKIERSMNRSSCHLHLRALRHGYWRGKRMTSCHRKEGTRSSSTVWSGNLVRTSRERGRERERAVRGERWRWRWRWRWRRNGRGNDARVYQRERRKRKSSQDLGESLFSFISSFAFLFSRSLVRGKIQSTK
jgi:hypothetical protein